MSGGSETWRVASLRRNNGAWTPRCSLCLGWTEPGAQGLKNVGALQLLRMATKLIPTTEIHHRILGGLAELGEDSILITERGHPLAVVVSTWGLAAAFGSGSEEIRFYTQAFVSSDGATIESEKRGVVLGGDATDQGVVHRSTGPRWLSRRYRRSRS